MGPVGLGNLLKPWSRWELTGFRNAYTVEHFLHAMLSSVSIGSCMGPFIHMHQVQERPGRRWACPKDWAITTSKVKKKKKKTEHLASSPNLHFLQPISLEQGQRREKKSVPPFLPLLQSWHHPSCLPLFSCHAFCLSANLFCIPFTVILEPTCLSCSRPCHLSLGN